MGMSEVRKETLEAAKRAWRAYRDERTEGLFPGGRTYDRVVRQMRKREFMAGYIAALGKSYPQVEYRVRFPGEELPKNSSITMLDEEEARTHAKRFKGAVVQTRTVLHDVETPWEDVEVEA